ncbi:MAG: hypothetical protein UY05_C0006G0014 [Candidatus Peregrinibacteria bacterium GW2011_GWA2_47_7]|nr:MAG: hypothetical protein UY05_C0006G0014 [Candidatus Peregrinibacteria bacterium GW2011_GWA2_47_7]
MKSTDLKEGPPESTFLTLVLKTCAGLGGGIVGTLVLLVIFLLGASIIQPTLSGVAQEEIHPLFIFVFVAMIFLASLGSNVVGSLLFAFVQHEKYTRVTSALYQIFIVNIVIVAIMAPIYLVVIGLGLEITAFVAGIQVIISALTSVMVLEIIGNLRYALVGVYSVLFSILFSTGVIFIFYQFTGRDLVLLLFITLPTIWMFLGFISSIVEMLYTWMYRLYGVDFLASTTDFGKDYGEVEPEDLPLPEDVAGGEFLGKE